MATGVEYSYQILCMNQKIYDHFLNTIPVKKSRLSVKNRTNDGCSVAKSVILANLKVLDLHAGLKLLKNLHR